MWRINGNGIFLKYKRRYIKLSIMKILNAVLPLVCILCFSSANAQKIYSVNSSYQTDVKVFVVEHEYQAELIVYKTDKDYRAKKSENKGIWFFTTKEYQADKKVFFVDHEYQADLKVYFTDKEYRAGWRKNDKKPLMY